MPEPLSITVAQPHCVPYDVAENAAIHAATVKRGCPSRVVLFPEMSLTGYHLDAPAITPDDPRLEKLVTACGREGSLALVGAPVQGEEGRCHIAMLAVQGSGVRVAYRKIWLSESEARRFSPGTQPEVLEVDGWRLGLAICKDTSIAQHASDTAARGCDAYLAATLKHPEQAELQDERARRIATEHQVWVAVASFAGSTGEGYDRAAGRSSIWRPEGVLSVRAGPRRGQLIRDSLGPECEEHQRRVRQIDEECLARELALTSDGVLPPPWLRFPEISRSSIGWRMGPGQGFMLVWYRWQESQSTEQLESYFRRFAPIPVAWVDWVTAQLFGPTDLEDEEPDVRRFAATLPGYFDLEGWLERHHRR